MININFDLKHIAKVFNRTAKFGPRAHRRYVKYENGWAFTKTRRERGSLKDVFNRTQRQIQRTLCSLTYEDIERTQRALNKISLGTETLRDRYARRAGNIFVRLGWIKPQEKLDTLHKADRLAEKIQAAQLILAKISEGDDDLSLLKEQFRVLGRGSPGFFLKLIRNSGDGMLFEPCRPVLEEIITEDFIAQARNYTPTELAPCLPYLNYRQLLSSANIRLPQGNNDELEPLRYLLRQPRRNFHLPNHFEDNDLPIWTKMARDCNNRPLLTDVYIAETRSIHQKSVNNYRAELNSIRRLAPMNKTELAKLQLLQRTQLLKNAEFRRTANLDDPFFRDLADLDEPFTTEILHLKAILYALKRHTNLDDANSLIGNILKLEKLNRSLASSSFTSKDLEDLHILFLNRVLDDDQLVEIFEEHFPLISGIISKNPHYEEEEEPNLQTLALIYLYQGMGLENSDEIAKYLLIIETLSRLSKLFFDKDWKNNDYRNLLQLAKDDIVHDKQFLKVFGNRIPLLQSLNKLGQDPEESRFALKVVSFILQVEKLCDPAHLNFEVIREFEIDPRKPLDRFKENNYFLRLATLGKYLSLTNENLYAEFRTVFPRIAELQRRACLPQDNQEPLEISSLRICMDLENEEKQLRAWTHLMQAFRGDRKLPFRGLQIEIPTIDEVSAETMAFIQQKFPYVAHAMNVKSRGTHQNLSIDDRILWRMPVQIVPQTYLEGLERRSPYGYRELFHFEFDGDCSVLLNGRERKVHSKIIQRALPGQNVVDENGRLKLTVELTPEELSAFLEYCYTESIAHLSDRILLQLYVKANALGSLALKNHCCAMIMATISMNNCLELYQEARKLGIVPIMQQCSRFIQTCNPAVPFTKEQKAIISSMVKSHFDSLVDMPQLIQLAPIYDFKLIGGDDIEIKAYLPLLAIHSGFFAGVLGNSTLETDSDFRFSLFEQFTGTTLSHVVHFAETGTLPANLSALDLYKLRKAADYFIMPKLLQRVEAAIKQPPPQPPVHVVAPPVRTAPAPQVIPHEQRYRIERIRQILPYPPGVPMGNNMFMSYREVKRPY